MKLVFPPGVGQFTDANGNLYTPDANGLVDIGTQAPDFFLAAGFVQLADNAGPTGTRPTTGIYAGLMYFDTTLNKPVWRNAANTGWVDATGTPA